MTALRLDDKAPYTPADTRTLSAANALDRNKDGTVTLDEVKRGSPAQQRALFDTLAFDEFLPKVHAWHAMPLWRALGGWIRGDVHRKEFFRVADLANLVGKLPTVNKIVQTGDSVIIRSRYDHER